jgi:uncharacterized membrane protein YcjF (UPF0283 family)
MEKKRVAFLEVIIGILLIIIGYIAWLWEKQLLWILIYPSPFAKQLIEILPFVFCGLGILLVIDGVRRIIKEVPPTDQNLERASR